MVFDIIKSIYTKINDADSRYILLYGGAGTGKSHTLAQFLILNYLVHNIGLYILVMRKTNPSLRITAYPLFLGLLNKFGIQYLVNKAEQTVYCNDNVVYFKSLDEPEKIKSLNLNIVWLEEATEFTYDDFIQVDLRVRRQGINKIYMTFNPTSPQHWIYTNFFDAGGALYDKSDRIKTHYKENPFLPKGYKQTLLGMKNKDEVYYKIYVLGEFASYQNIVYAENVNYVVTDFNVDEFNEIIYGLDFGYNNPTCLLKISVKDSRMYIVEELYQQQLLTKDLINLMEGRINPNSYIFCDSAEPDRIEELNRAGFNAVPAYKNVKDGIDTVKNYSPIYINSHCINLIKELRNYVWKKDTSGNNLDEPVKVYDHAVDAMRYAIATYIKDYTGDKFEIKVL